MKDKSAMSCLFVYDSKFQKDGKHIYSSGRINDSILRYFVSPSDNITALTRMESIKENDILSKITLENVNFTPVKGVLFSSIFTKHLIHNIRLTILEIKNTDFIVVRLPSFLGVFVLSMNLAFKKNISLK